MRQFLWLLVSFFIFTTPFYSHGVQTLGEQKVVVLVFKFQDSSEVPGTVDFFQNLVFNDVSNYYREASYGQTYFTGNVFGPFILPISKASCNTGLVRDEADKAAIAAGINLSNYMRIVYIGPNSSSNSCMGGTNDGSASLPSRTYLFSTYNANLRFFAHEMAHNFGLSHSMAWECGTEIYAPSCQQVNYGSPLDVMGSGSKTLFGASQRERLGWITPNTPQKITHVTASGIYVIDNLENTAAGVKAIKVQYGISPDFGTPIYYYAEYRQPVGYDVELTTMGNLVKGIAINEAGPQRFSYLLDMTPNSYADTYTDIQDSALEVGRTFSNNEAGVSIKLLSINSTSATIQVDISNPCVRNSPTLSISPSSQSTSVAGTSLNYSITIKNNDSQECTASAMNLSKVVPSGFNSSLSASSVNLAPGASQTINMSVASSTSSVAGTYSFSASAVNGSSSKSASANGSYVISTKKGGGKPRR